jgi:TonB family protein
MKKLIFIIILATVCSVQAQTGDKENLKQINEKVISSYQKQLLDDALKFARQAVELSNKIYGAENQETAPAYTNLGIIYRELKKFKESIENLQKSAAIYQKLPNTDAKELIEVYETLALSQRMGGQKVEAETSYLKAIETAENKLGKESKELLSPMLNLANLYARDKNSEKDSELYLKSYALAIKLFGEDSKQTESVNIYRAYYSQNNLFSNDEKSKERKKKYSEIRGYEFGDAVNLPKPPYPRDGMTLRKQGKIVVKVWIDESGNVKDAKAVFGEMFFSQAAEEAAKKAKFKATIRNGKPRAVINFITYEFFAS